MEKKNIIIIISVILCIALIVLLALLMRRSPKNERGDEQFREEYLSETVIPSNIIVLYNYKGANSRTDLYKSFKQFIDIIQSISKQVKDPSSSGDYFDSNYIQVRENLGINRKDDFESLVKAILGKNLDYTKYVYSKIDPDSISDSKDYFEFNIDFYFGKDVESSVPLNVHVMWSNYKNMSDTVKYKIN